MDQGSAQTLETIKQRIGAIETELVALKQQLASLQTIEREQLSRTEPETSEPDTTDTEAAMIAASTEPADEAIVADTEEDETPAVAQPEEQIEATQAVETSLGEAEKPLEQPEMPYAQQQSLRQEMSSLDQAAKALNIPTGPSPNEKALDRKTLSDKAAHSAVSDLKKAIGINERFLYANELFRGDMEAFNRAIEEINHLQSGYDAKRLLNEQLAPKFKWNEEAETVVQFRELVERKFSTAR